MSITRLSSQVYSTHVHPHTCTYMSSPTTQGLSLVQQDDARLWQNQERDKRNGSEISQGCQTLAPSHAGHEVSLRHLVVWWAHLQTTQTEKTSRSPSEGDSHIPIQSLVQSNVLDLEEGSMVRILLHSLA